MNEQRLSDNNGPSDLLWLPDGTVIYRLQEPRPNLDSEDIWSVNVDPDSGRRRGDPAQVTTGIGFGQSTFSTSQDAKRIAFLRWRTHDSVRVADLRTAVEMGPSQALQGDEWDRAPLAWTLDSQEVLFSSNAQGKSGVYKQNLRSHEGQLLASARVSNAAVSPDGQSLLFKQQSSGDSAQHSDSLMRLPINGGPTTLLLNGDFSFHCASQAKICVLSEQTKEGHVFSLLDASKGRGVRLAEVHDPRHAIWALIPDGKKIGIVFDASQSKLHVINIDGGAPLDIEFKDSLIQSLTWATDNQHLYASGFINLIPQIFRLSLDGQSKTLLKSDFGRDWLYLVDVSPDGRHLSYGVRSFESNVVLLENF